MGRHQRTREKDMAYECGVTPTGDARDPFSVHYYLVALLFILFDIEAIFLYPWALVYRGLGWFGFVEMVLYIIILFSGYIYLWKKGALELIARSTANPSGVKRRSQREWQKASE